MTDLIEFETKLRAQLVAAGLDFSGMWVHDVTNGWMRVSFPDERSAGFAREHRRELLRAASAVIDRGVVSRVDIGVRPEGAKRTGWFA